MPLGSLGEPIGTKKMAKRSKVRPTPSAPRKASEGARPEIVHSSLYLPEPVYEALRRVAFEERCKIHDVVMEGIGLALRKRGYPALDDLKAGGKR
jgi:hypothetical protein